MGYDFHITRKAHWADDEGDTITEEEWLRIIEEDPELSVDTESELWFKTGKAVLACWKGEPCAIYQYDGEIITKNPDDAFILKMIEIAERLGATVQGDDGERYPEALTTAPAPGQRRSGILSILRRVFRRAR